MGPVPVVEEPEPWTRHAREVRQRQRAITEDDKHSKVKVSCGLVPTNASRELFLDCRQLGNKRKTPKSSGQVLVNAVIVQVKSARSSMSGTSLTLSLRRDADRAPRRRRWVMHGNQNVKE